MRVTKHRAARAPRRRHGAAATELALILPLLMTLVLGTVDFGRFAYHHIALTNAAQAGAAFGAMNPFTTATQSSWQAGVQQAVADEMAQQTGFDSGMLTAAVETTAEAGGLRRVRVQASYPFKTLIDWPGIPTSDGTPINLTRTSVLRAIR